MTRTFPNDFLFGCATSAYQVEGGIENDWALWERRGRLKDPDARCGDAVDHWHRYEADFDLLADLGANAYRLSIEWARVEPSPGQFDEEALKTYKKMIDALRARDIEPFVTLLHFTHPPWFHETCPWHDADKEPERFFERYTERVAGVLGDSVRFFTVINEPAVWLIGGYLAGLIPPGQSRQLRLLGDAAAGLIRAHVRARRTLKRICGEQAQIGVAHNVLRFSPFRRASPADQIAAAYIAKQYNHVVPRALTTGHLQLGLIPGVRIIHRIPEAEGSLDFLGINYYTRVFVRANALPWSKKKRLEVLYDDREGAGITDLGWEIHPRGLTESLMEASRYRLPIYITENGLDDRDDSRRSAYLYDHLGAVLDARAQGAPVRGYFFWSLIDNFEWLEAFGPRFGIYRVDRKTQTRTPTQAVSLFQEVADTHTLPNQRPEEMVRRGKSPTPAG